MRGIGLINDSVLNVIVKDVIAIESFVNGALCLRTCACVRSIRILIRQIIIIILRDVIVNNMSSGSNRVGNMWEYAGAHSIAFNM